TFVGLRLTLASLGFIALYLLSRGKRKWPKDGLLWRRASFLGVIGTAIPMASFVSSMQYQSSGITSVLITISPAITVLIAHFALPDERLTLSKSMGIALAFSGALFLALRGESGLLTIGKVNPIGYGLVFLGISCSSVSNVYIRKKMRNFPPMDVAAVRMLTAAIVAMPIALLTSNFNMRQVNAQGWLVLLFAAIIGTFFAFLLDFYNTQRFGASTAVMVSYVVPIVGVLGGALLLDEQITMGMLGGMLLIVLGVGLIVRRQTAGQRDNQQFSDKKV
ncbi:MAG: DMT family transporter, partial [Anaerolineae bacterium]|nr:DMT family transporter [Anaerolineae bacterium]